jgi:phosphoribosylformimino-5-aminoimidazole carboxamide ribotide isomerase
MLEGTATKLYQKILNFIPDIYLIASGGLSSIADIELLIESNVPAVITGKAIYEGRITLKELSKYC